jgi:MerR family transcriptional regulator, mercuric resistance operon regulatory protein
MPEASFSIAGVAKGAGVGVETVRYYERRGLVSQRAQELGLTLKEIETLLVLEDGADRSSIRHIAKIRLEEIRRRIADLKSMERALARVLHECEAHKEAPHCPIIAAIASNSAGKAVG